LVFTEAYFYFQDFIITLFSPECKRI